MADIMFVIIGVTAGSGLLLGSIITTFCCCKRYRRNRSTSHQQPSKQRQDDDYFDSVIINQHIAKHLRPESTLSFVSDHYHNDMTLIASPRRLAMLEQQQKQEPVTLVIGNPYVSASANVDDVNSTPTQSFVYENPSLELDEFITTNHALQF